MDEQRRARRRPLRVTVVQQYGEMGGAEYWLLRLLDATDELRTSVVMLRDGPLRAELLERRIPVTVLEVGREPADLVRAWRPLRRVLVDQAPDVLLANGVKAQAALGPVPWLVRKPGVWVKHDHSFDRALTPALARVATKVVVTTEELVAPTHRRDVVTIPPPRPRDLPLPRDEARRRLLGMVGASDCRLLVMLSRLTPYKGVDTAVLAMAHPEASGWQLLVLGAADPAEPGERERLLGLAREHGVADRFHLAGHVEGASTLLAGADALAVLTRRQGPRTPGREGFGMAAMEATIAGTPVLAPDDGGPIAVRASRGGGLLVDATSPRALASALGQLTPSRLHQLRSEALALAPLLFEDAPTAAQRLVGVLDAAVAQRRLGSRRRAMR